MSDQVGRRIIGLQIIPVAIPILAILAGIAGWLLLSHDSLLNRASAIDAVCEWARLAPFPSSAENIRIEVGGNMFTREFCISFIAPPEDIQKWLRVSPGTSETGPEIQKDGTALYEIKPGRGAVCAEARVSSIMNTPAVPNSLLRVEKTEGEPPAPFERPNPNMNLFVLELGSHESVDSWLACVTETIRCHGELLRDLRRVGATVSLFVECGAALPILRLEAPFLGMLCQTGISLECCHDRGV